MRTEIAFRRVALDCAIFMLFGPVGGRTTWVQRHTITTDAAGYNMATLLSGVVALVALVAEAWSRQWAVAAALVAAAAFAAGTWVAGSYWLGFPQGDRLREGQEMLGRKVEVHFPLLLPVFALAAVAGLVCALALVMHGWPRQPRGA